MSLPQEVRDKLQATLSKLSPEQQQIYLRNTPLIVKLQSLYRKQQMDKAAAVAATANSTNTATVISGPNTNLPITVQVGKLLDKELFFCSLYNV